jgi:uncharacterized membrane protein YdbT with pleckstrin-like domain
MSADKLFRHHAGEKTELALRTHPIIFVKSILLFLLMAGLPVVALYQATGGEMPAFPSDFVKAAGVLLGSAYYLGITLFFFSQFADYYLDINIVTNQRIIDIEQEGLFSRTIAELNLTRVQDVESVVKGIFATMFNYGTVIIQTAGEERNFIFKKIPDPHSVRHHILELAAADRKHEAKEILSDTLTDQTTDGT